MSEAKPIRFYQLLEQQLNREIKKHVSAGLTPETMRRIRESIRQIINGVFSKSNHKLSEPATTWLTDQYFKGIRVNEDQLMSDCVVINEYNLSELEFNDIQLLRNLFLETQLGESLDKEFRQRNAS